MTDTSELQKLLGAASSLPWEADLDASFNDGRGNVKTASVFETKNGARLFDMDANEDQAIVEETDGDEFGTWTDAHDGKALANAALIVAAVNAMPEYIEQQATIARLTAERDALVEALRPFASEAGCYSDDLPDSHWMDGEHIIDLGDLRRARDAVRKASAHD